MKEQARLKEEMAYLFKIGNNEVRNHNAALVLCTFRTCAFDLSDDENILKLSVGSDCYTKKIGS